MNLKNFKLANLGLYVNWIDNLKIVFNDSERKTLLQIINEILRLMAIFKRFPVHYFGSLLYKKNTINYLDYLDLKEMEKIQEILTDKSIIDILDNKLFFNSYFSKTDIMVPKVLAFNFGETALVCNDNSYDYFNLNDYNSLNVFLKNLFIRSKSKSFFIKPINSSCGKNTLKISMLNNNLKDPEIENVQSFLLAGSFIIQDEVVQHELLADLNPTSLNTIRIDTFRARGEDPQILSAYLRIGLLGSYIDNIRSGGIFVGVDIKEGKLKDTAYTMISKGGLTYKNHPDSKIKFSGLCIPYFENAKKIALDASRILPQAMIGWDISISKEGPVLIEGNALYYGMKTSDVAYGGYRRNPVYIKAQAISKSIYR
jgi:hypothetical protein